MIMSDLLLQTIKEEIAKPKMRFQSVDECLHNNNLWPEVCKRYAFEVAKASLKEAAINTQHHHPGSDTASITDPCNIKL